MLKMQTEFDRSNLLLMHNSTYSLRNTVSSHVVYERIVVIVRLEVTFVSIVGKLKPMFSVHVSQNEGIFMNTISVEDFQD